VRGAQVCGSRTFSRSGVPRPAKPKPPPEFLLLAPNAENQVVQLAVKGPNGLGAVVDSMIKRSDIAVQDGLKAIEDNAGGGPKSYGIKENGISLASLEPTVDASQGTVMSNQEVPSKVKELRGKIASGELKVADPATR
jgi:basic membrane lipoprotein Med (substrate-binding protein (PBP1-ABC) superfamily)